MARPVKRTGPNERRCVEWMRLGRPLEVARFELLTGRRMIEQPNGAAEQALGEAAAMYEELGVSHLAARARALAGT